MERRSAASGINLNNLGQFIDIAWCVIQSRHSLERVGRVNSGIKNIWFHCDRCFCLVLLPRARISRLRANYVVVRHSISDRIGYKHGNSLRDEATGIAKEFSEMKLPGQGTLDTDFNIEGKVDIARVRTSVRAFRNQAAVIFLRCTQFFLRFTTSCIAYHKITINITFRFTPHIAGVSDPAALIVRMHRDLKLSSRIIDQVSACYQTSVSRLQPLFFSGKSFRKYYG